MSEVKKCPKCGGKMVEGEFLKNLPKVAISQKGRRHYDKTAPVCCQNCGFIEIYKEKKD